MSYRSEEPCYFSLGFCSSYFVDHEEDSTKKFDFKSC